MSDSGATSLHNTTSSYPVATIFVPISVPTNLGASIIGARPDKTTFAVGCLPEPSSSCDLATSITVTGGESTLIYTMTDDNAEGSAQPPATVHCNLEGGSLATAATCTGHSAISGLGEVGVTSTLAASQMSYAPLTITAGAAKLTDAQRPLGESGGMSKSGDGGSAANSGATINASSRRWELAVVIMLAILETL